MACTHPRELSTCSSRPDFDASKQHVEDENTEASLDLYIETLEESDQDKKKKVTSLSSSPLHPDDTSFDIYSGLDDNPQPASENSARLCRASNHKAAFTNLGLESDDTTLSANTPYAELLCKYKTLRNNMLSLCYTAQREMQQKLAIIAELREGIRQKETSQPGSTLSHTAASAEQVQFIRPDVSHAFVQTESVYIAASEPQSQSRPTRTQVVESNTLRHVHVQTLPAVMSQSSVQTDNLVVLARKVQTDSATYRVSSAQTVTCVLQSSKVQTVSPAFLSASIQTESTALQEASTETMVTVVDSKSVQTHADKDEEGHLKVGGTVNQIRIISDTFGTEIRSPRSERDPEALTSGRSVKSTKTGAAHYVRSHSCEISSSSSVLSEPKVRARRYSLSFEPVSDITRHGHIFASEQSSMHLLSLRFNSHIGSSENTCKHAEYPKPDNHSTFASNETVMDKTAATDVDVFGAVSRMVNESNVCSLQTTASKSSHVADKLLRNQNENPCKPTHISRLQHCVTASSIHLRKCSSSSADSRVSEMDISVEEQVDDETRNCGNYTGCELEQDDTCLSQNSNDSKLLLSPANLMADLAANTQTSTIGSLALVTGMEWKRKLFLWSDFSHRKVSRRKEIDAVYFGRCKPKFYDWQSSQPKSESFDREENFDAVEHLHVSDGFSEGNLLPKQCSVVQNIKSDMCEEDNAMPEYLHMGARQLVSEEVSVKSAVNYDCSSQESSESQSNCVQSLAEQSANSARTLPLESLVSHKRFPVLKKHRKLLTNLKNSLRQDIMGLGKRKKKIRKSTKRRKILAAKAAQQIQNNNQKSNEQFEFEQESEKCSHNLQTDLEEAIPISDTHSQHSWTIDFAEEDHLSQGGKLTMSSAIVNKSYPYDIVKHSESLGHAACNNGSRDISIIAEDTDADSVSEEEIPGGCVHAKQSSLHCDIKNVDSITIDKCSENEKSCMEMLQDGCFKNFQSKVFTQLKSGREIVGKAKHRMTSISDKSVPVSAVSVQNESKLLNSDIIATSLFSVDRDKVKGNTLNKKSTTQQCEDSTCVETVVDEFVVLSTTTQQCEDSACVETVLDEFVVLSTKELPHHVAVSDTSVKLLNSEFLDASEKPNHLDSDGLNSFQAAGDVCKQGKFVEKNLTSLKSGLQNPSLIWSPEKTSSNIISLRQPENSDLFRTLSGFALNSLGVSEHSLSLNGNNKKIISSARNLNEKEDTQGFTDSVTSHPAAVAHFSTDESKVVDQTPVNVSDLAETVIRSKDDERHLASNDQNVIPSTDEKKNTSVNQTSLSSDDSTPLFGYPSYICAQKGRTKLCFQYKRTPNFLASSSSSTSVSCATASTSSSSTSLHSSPSLSALVCEETQRSSRLSASSTTESSGRLETVRQEESKQARTESMTVGACSIPASGLSSSSLAVASAGAGIVADGVTSSFGTDNKKLSNKEKCMSGSETGKTKSNDSNEAAVKSAEIARKSTGTPLLGLNNHTVGLDLSSHGLMTELATADRQAAQEGLQKDFVENLEGLANSVTNTSKIAALEEDSLEEGEIRTLDGFPFAAVEIMAGINSLNSPCELGTLAGENAQFKNLHKMLQEKRQKSTQISDNSETVLALVSSENQQRKTSQSQRDKVLNFNDEVHVPDFSHLKHGQKRDNVVERQHLKRRKPSSCKENAKGNLDEDKKAKHLQLKKRAKQDEIRLEIVSHLNATGKMLYEENLCDSTLKNYKIPKLRKKSRFRKQDKQAKANAHNNQSSGIGHKPHSGRKTSRDSNETVTISRHEKVTSRDSSLVTTAIESNSVLAPLNIPPVLQSTTSASSSSCNSRCTETSKPGNSVMNVQPLTRSKLNSGDDTPGDLAVKCSQSEIPNAQGTSDMPSFHSNLELEGSCRTRLFDYDRDPFKPRPALESDLELDEDNFSDSLEGIELSSREHDNELEEDCSDETDEEQITGTQTDGEGENEEESEDMEDIVEDENDEKLMTDTELEQNGLESCGRVRNNRRQEQMQADINDSDAGDYEKERSELSVTIADVVGGGKSAVQGKKRKMSIDNRQLLTQSSYSEDSDDGHANNKLSQEESSDSHDDGKMQLSERGKIQQNRNTEAVPIKHNSSVSFSCAKSQINGKVTNELSVDCLSLDDAFASAEIHSHLGRKQMNATASSPSAQSPSGSDNIKVTYWNEQNSIASSSQRSQVIEYAENVKKLKHHSILSRSTDSKSSASKCPESKKVSVSPKESDRKHRSLSRSSDTGHKPWNEDMSWKRKARSRNQSRISSSSPSFKEKEKLLQGGKQTERRMECCDGCQKHSSVSNDKHNSDCCERKSNSSERDLKTSGDLAKSHRCCGDRSSPKNRRHGTKDVRDHSASSSQPKRLEREHEHHNDRDIYKRYSGTYSRRSNRGEKTKLGNRHEHQYRSRARSCERDRKYSNGNRDRRKDRYTQALQRKPYRHTQSSYRNRNDCSCDSCRCAHSCHSHCCHSGQRRSRSRSPKRCNKGCCVDNCYKSRRSSSREARKKICH